MAAISLTAAQIAPVNEIQYVAHTGIAAVAITKGQALYENSAGKMALTDTDAAGTAVFDGIALNAAAANEPVTFLILGALYGFDLSGMDYRAAAYLAAVAGGLDTAGDGVQDVIIGRVRAMSDSDLTKVLFVNALAAA